jgi:hypothetical protein
VQSHAATEENVRTIELRAFTLLATAIAIASTALACSAAADGTQPGDPNTDDNNPPPAADASSPTSHPDANTPPNPTPDAGTPPKVDGSTPLPPADAATPDDAPSGGQGKVIHDVYITWYGFNDNSCQVETQHNCNTIAYPKNGGFPTKHDEAVEGKGTYDDPITFATACGDDGKTDCEFLPGTIIYVPEVRKYFVMEDQCFECGQDWAASPAHTHYHTDLWMGPSVSSSAPNALNACEDNLTLGASLKGTGTIVVDPPSNYPVEPTVLFTAANVCTAVTYPANTVP